VIGKVLSRSSAALRPAPVRVLVAALAVGFVVRMALMVQWRPAFIGYPDTGAYLLDAFEPSTYPFLDPLRVVGYGVFIHGLHDLSANLSAVTLAQHGLGLATALVLYVALRQLGVRSRWVAVVPAAVVALGGSQVLFEHAILTESLWLSLVALSLLALAVAARDELRPLVAFGAALLAGVALGLSVPVRLPGLFALPVFLVWMAFAAGGSKLRRFGLAAVVLVGFVVVVYAFASWQEDKTGRFGLSRNGALNLYGRVAPWADCTKFDPPKDTRFLCETTPVRERSGHDFYVFAGGPASTRFGTGGLTAVLSPEGSRQLQAWSRAAILGQPLTYLHAVLRESRRLIDPDAAAGLPGQTSSGFGLGPQAYPPLLESADRDVNIVPIIAASYPGGGGVKRSDLSWFHTYEEVTRPHPLLMALMIALAALAPFVTRGSERRAAWLLTPTAFLLLALPVATSIYDYRYVFPLLGFLSGAAAIGGWGVLTAARGALAQRRLSRHPGL
jgi:hypothetical protein